MAEVEAFDNFEEEQPQVFEQAPVVQPAELPDIKLFGRWSSDDIHISDISVSDYIAVKEKHAKYLPHSAGRYAAKRFRKAQCPIVERLTNSLMMKGRNNVKTRPVSVAPVPSVVKPSTCRPCVVSTRLSGCCALEPAKLHSVTLRPSPNAWLMS
ncbi:hypothetical protein RP20_CCG018057 [Aedes albopictus]|nr:hypothetical protein RP20_CCG002052 [Aedes albopictus]KXJ84155.1 hypothetical protein RP20_CCG018057 [Aedes albopictus]